ncbi:hypothetical protein ABPG72_010050 [Tetrahymena utriculariae]
MSDFYKGISQYEDQSNILDFQSRSQTQSKQSLPNSNQQHLYISDSQNCQKQEYQQYQSEIVQNSIQNAEQQVTELEATENNDQYIKIVATSNVNDEQEEEKQENQVQFKLGNKKDFEFIKIAQCKVEDKIQYSVFFQTDEEYKLFQKTCRLGDVEINMENNFIEGVSEFIKQEVEDEKDFKQNCNVVHIFMDFVIIYGKILFFQFQNKESCKQEIKCLQSDSDIKYEQNRLEFEYSDNEYEYSFDKKIMKKDRVDLKIKTFAEIFVECD